MLTDRLLLPPGGMERWFRWLSHPLFIPAAQDNAIYNLLPDIVSRLSDPERAMSAEDYHVIMK